MTLICALFHQPTWAVVSYSSGHQPEELPKSMSTQPRFARRWDTLYDRAIVPIRHTIGSARLKPIPHNFMVVSLSMPLVNTGGSGGVSIPRLLRSYD